MPRRSSLLAILVLLTGCAVRSGELDPAMDSAESEHTARGTRSSGPQVEDDEDDEVCRTAPGPSRRDLVCHRWRCEGREGAIAASWSGDASTCNAGDLDGGGAERALRVLNLHRFLAGLDDVTVEAPWSGPAQQCALLAHANAKLSHTPPSDWRCWSDVAAFTSSVSLIANRSAPLSIAAFIEDPGNEATMVHRRWLLSEKLTRIGLGSTDRYACVVVDGRGLPAKLGAADGRTASPAEAAEGASRSEPSPRPWVAWPPPGPVPMDVFATERLDEIGWTVQSSDDDLDRGVVTVSVGGRQLPVRTTHLVPLLGSRSALRFVPDGWSTEAGLSYEVRVTTDVRSFDFTVEPTDCP